MLALFARRVAADDAEAPQAGVFPDEGSHVPHAHDAQRPVVRASAPLCTGEVGQYGTAHCSTPRALQPAAVATRMPCAAHHAVSMWSNPMVAVAIRRTRTCEQAFVAAGAGADDQGVGVAHVLRGDPAAGQVAYLGPRLEDSCKGDGTVGDDFHGWLLFLISFLPGSKYREK